MWADTQRDGHQAKCTWCPLLNAIDQVAKIMKPRHKAQWNLMRCPKLANWSQLLVGWSSLYCEDMWRFCSCLTSFFLIVDTCLSWKDIARQSCAMVSKWRIFVSCIFSEPRAAYFRPAF